MNRTPGAVAGPPLRASRRRGTLDDVSETWTALGAEDAPAIVFVHGTRLSRGMWQPQMAALSGAFRVVALDLPGHGALRDDPFRWDDAVAEVVRVIDVAARGRAVLVGLSLGGYVAMDVAVRHPERVAGLVISGASADPRGLLGPPIGALAAVMDRTPARLLEGANRLWFRNRYPARTANAIIAGGFAYGAGAAALRQLRGRRFAAALAAYPGPVLILNGRLDPPFLLGQRRFGRALPDVRFVVLRGATHLANLDRPSAFSAAVARFAASVWKASDRAAG